MKRRQDYHESDTKSPIHNITSVSLFLNNVNSHFSEVPFVAVTIFYIMRDPSPAIKRQKLDTNQESLVLGESESSAYNARVFRKIQKHLAADPDVDILSLLPTGYSDRLAEKKKRQAPGDT